MVADPPPTVQGPTRDRLLAAGIALFGQKGYRATTVAEIEVAAGLQPRRGALYRHFPSKHALLEAAVQTHLDAVDAISHTIEDAAAGPVPVRELADALGRWLLGELDREQYLTSIFEHDGDLVPELRDRFREQVSDAGYRATGTLLRRWAGEATDAIDLDAYAVALASPLINFRRSTWTFRRPPLGIDDGRMIAAWVELCERLVASLGGGPGPRTRPR